MRTRKPRAWSSAARLAAIRPLPSEETTPPVMKMNRAMGFGSYPRNGASGKLGAAAAALNPQLETAVRALLLGGSGERIVGQRARRSWRRSRWSLIDRLGRRERI